MLLLMHHLNLGATRSGANKNISTISCLITLSAHIIKLLSAARAYGL